MHRSAPESLWFSERKSGLLSEIEIQILHRSYFDSERVPEGDMYGFIMISLEASQRGAQVP